MPGKFHNNLYCKAQLEVAAKHTVPDNRGSGPDPPTPKGARSMKIRRRDPMVPPPFALAGSRAPHEPRATSRHRGRRGMPRESARAPPTSHKDECWAGWHTDPADQQPLIRLSTEAGAVATIHTTRHVPVRQLIGPTQINHLSAGDCGPWGSAVSQRGAVSPRPCTSPAAPAALPDERAAGTRPPATLRIAGRLRRVPWILVDAGGADPRRQRVTGHPLIREAGS